MGTVGTPALDVHAFLQAHVVRPGCTLGGYSHTAQQPEAMNTGHHILGCYYNYDDDNDNDDDYQLLCYSATSTGSTSARPVLLVLLLQLLPWYRGHDC